MSLTLPLPSLSLLPLFCQVVVGVCLLGVFGILSNLFDGQVVAKLPFEPFSLMRTMSHRGLPGTNPTDCAFVFLYVLSQMSIRANIVKYLGFTPAATGPSMFQPPSQQ